MKNFLIYKIILVFLILWMFWYLSGGPIRVKNPTLFKNYQITSPKVQDGKALYLDDSNPSELKYREELLNATKTRYGEGKPEIYYGNTR